MHSERSLWIFFIIFERMHGMQQEMCQIMNFFMIYSYSGLEINTNLFVKHSNERQLHAGRHILIQQFSLYAMVRTKNWTNLDRLYVVKYKVSGLDQNQLIDISILSRFNSWLSLPS